MPESPVRAHGNVRDALNIYYDTHRRNTEKVEKHNLHLSDDDELPPKEFKDYPKALFAPDGETIVVENLTEERQKVAEGYFATYEEFLRASAATEGEQPDEAEETVYAGMPERGPGGRFLKKT